MLKKKPNATGLACTSTASDGALRCVLPARDALGRGHAVHATSKAGRSAPQYTTWATADDGRIRIIEYARGKRKSERFEDASKPQGKLCSARLERGADGTRIPKEKQVSCGRDPGHPPPHRGFALEGNHVSQWNGDGSKGSLHVPKDDVDGLAALATEDESKGRAARKKPTKFRIGTFAAIPTAGDAWNCGCSGISGTLATRHMMGDADCEYTLNGGARTEKRPKSPAREVSIGTFPITPITAGDDRAPTAELRILGYRRHPAAALFQLLEGEALQALANSIKANGQRDQIVLVTVDGETFILDGSNRGIACELLGIVPQFTSYEGPKDLQSLIDYSMDKNKHRRHQEPSVLAMVAVDAGQLLGRGNPGDRETGRSAGLMTQAEAGKRLGVSERLVRRAKVVHDKGTPKLNEAVRKGRIAVDAAEAVTKLPKVKQDEIADEALARKSGELRGGRVRALVRQEEKRAVVRKINTGRVMPMPLGPFGVIYGDYPWLFENSDQHEGSRGHMTYPPMTLEEIVAHARDTRSRAAESCILALWTTNWHIIKQMPQVLDAYGAEHRTVITWPKEKAGVGSWPRGKTEHLVIASIGEPVHTLNEVTTLLESYALREHSRKPDEVADLLREHCSGPFLELFGRDARDGWQVWGAETEKFTTEAA